MKTSTSSNSKNYFSLLHVCNALNLLPDQKIQLLNRILFSRLEDLRLVENKLSVLELKYRRENILPIISTGENVIAGSRKKIQFEKNYMYLNQQIYGLQSQIKDITKTILDYIHEQSTLYDRSLVQEIQGKLMFIER